MLFRSKGINKTFILLGAVIMVLTTIFSRFLKNPDGLIIDIESRDKTQISAESHDWKYMIKTTYFYKLWIMMAFLSSSGLMIISHIVNIAKVQSGMENGYILIIFLSITNFSGRIIAGTLSDKIGRINLLKVVLILQGINMAFFRIYDNLVLLTLGVAIVGFCYGATFSVFPAAISDKYGSKNYGKNYAVIYTAWGFSGVIGPMSAAAIFDASGSYGGSYIVAFILLVISVFIAFSVKEEKGFKESLAKV